MYGSDAKNAMEPNEFKILCQEIRDLEMMIDNPVNKTNVEEIMK